MCVSAAAVVAVLEIDDVAVAAAAFPVKMRQDWSRISNPSHPLSRLMKVIKWQYLSRFALRVRNIQEFVDVY